MAPGATKPALVAAIQAQCPVAATAIRHLLKKGAGHVPTAHTCHRCGVVGEKLFVCAACRGAYYCSERCKNAAAARVQQ